MKWEKEAESAIKKVPFFVRKKVRKRVEAHAQSKDKSIVTLSDVNELKAKFLSKGGMEKEIKGYDVSTCFGGDGCPNVAAATKTLALDIEKLLEKACLLAFLKQEVKEDLKFHHEFRVALADCPNACSRPQIVDIGIIGASVPGVSDEPCSQCNACVEVCRENAIAIRSEDGVAQIDDNACIMCKQCVLACPTQTLVEKAKGYRVLLGGRLGRHPRLGLEVPGLKTHEDVLNIVQKSLSFYKSHSKNGQRFSHLLGSLKQILG